MPSVMRKLFSPHDRSQQVATNGVQQTVCPRRDFMQQLGLYAIAMSAGDTLLADAAWGGTTSAPDKTFPIGIGAKLALTILSGASPDELARFVSEGDSAALTRLPGIGKKTAERIIIELRDKLDHLPETGALPGAGSAAVPANAASEATHALASLGFKPQEASRLVREVAKPEMSAEDIIRLALKATIKS